MNRNNIINGFAHKHRCSRFDQQRMIEAIILELEELKRINKTDDCETDLTDAGPTQANDELLKNAIVITKRAHKIWDKVEKYRCKLVYGLDLGVPVLDVNDIEDINIALQEYSGVLIEAVFNLTGKYIPHVSDYERSGK